MVGWTETKFHVLASPSRKIACATSLIREAFHGSFSSCNGAQHSAVLRSLDCLSHCTLTHRQTLQQWVNRRLSECFLTGGSMLFTNSVSSKTSECSIWHRISFSSCAQSSPQAQLGEAAMAAALVWASGVKLEMCAADQLCCGITAPILRSCGFEEATT